MMKPVEKLTAIIVAANKHKEHDLRLTLFSNEGIRIVYATGAQKPTAKLKGALQLFNVCEFTITGARVMTAHILQGGMGIAADLNRFYLASSIAETLAKLMREYHEDHHQIFLDTIVTLNLLGNSSVSCFKIFIHFYSHLLVNMGYGLEESPHADKLAEFYETENLDDVEIGLTEARNIIREIAHAFMVNMDFAIPHLDRLTN